MNSIVNLMGKYDHRQHELSDWLLELEQRFQLGQVDTDRAKITWCQLLIGAAGSSILASLEDGATWEAAKETLLSRLGAGSVRDEAWASLKQLKRGSKEIIELAGKAEKLAKCLHPRDEEAAERHAVSAFLSALDRPLAAEVRKLGYNNMEEVVAAARRIERILQEQPTSGMDTLMEFMNRQIQILTKDLAKAHEKLVAQPMVASATAALAVPPSQAVAATQHPPASLAPPSNGSPCSLTATTHGYSPSTPIPTGPTHLLLWRWGASALSRAETTRQTAYAVLPLWWRGALCIPLSCPNSVTTPAAATSSRASQAAAQGASTGAPCDRWQL